MASSLLQIFEHYQKARVQFVQSVAEAATRPQNIDTMQNAGVMQLLRPLLLDNVSRCPACHAMPVLPRPLNAVSRRACAATMDACEVKPVTWQCATSCTCCGRCVLCVHCRAVCVCDREPVTGGRVSHTGRTIAGALFSCTDARF